jgi:hypothetical protein
MRNRKKNLIEALHGSFMFLDNLPELIDKETIYDETGHVDLEFMTAILQWMSRMADISVKVQTSLNRLLGCEELADRKAKKADNGSKWNVEEILRHCTLEDNVLKLPSVQFNKKSYLEAKKWIEEAGGTWAGGKVQGFTFPFDATRVFSVLHEGKRCNLKQDYQFFETPEDVADWLVMIAGGIEETDTVLEPSAGRGALVKSIHRSCPSVMVDCYELMPENKQFLSSMENTNIIGDDFTKGDNKKYTKIIANPPFSGNQDIKHVRMMFDLLENGGTLAAITSTHWEFASETVCIDFRQWLKDLNANVYVINDGEFKESGASIETRAIVIKKTQNK